MSLNTKYTAIALMVIAACASALGYLYYIGAFSAATQPPTQLRVFIASSLINVAQNASQTFEKANNCQIIFNSAGIQHPLPADHFRFSMRRFHVRRLQMGQPTQRLKFSLPKQLPEFHHQHPDSATAQRQLEKHYFPLRPNQTRRKNRHS